MATTTKNMQVTTGNANASVTAQVTDSMPGVPCPGPAGYIYKGLRYVPVFADPIEWNSGNSYEAFTIVMHEGNSYTSKQSVPVGIDIANETFWVKTFDFNAQLESVRNSIKPQIYETLQTASVSKNLKQGDIIETSGKFAAGDRGGAIYLLDGGDNPDAVINNVNAHIINDYRTPEMYYTSPNPSDCSPFFTQAMNASKMVKAEGVYNVTTPIIIDNEHTVININKVNSTVLNYPTVVLNANYSSIDISFMNIVRGIEVDQPYAQTGTTVGISVRGSYNTIKITESRRFTCAVEFAGINKACIYNSCIVSYASCSNGVAFNNQGTGYTNGNMVRDSIFEISSSIYDHSGVIAISDSYIMNANTLEFAIESTPDSNNVAIVNLSNARGWNIKVTRSEINVNDNPNNVIEAVKFSNTTFQNKVEVYFNWNYYTVNDLGTKNSVIFDYANKSVIVATEKQDFYDESKLEWNAAHTVYRVRNLIPFNMSTQKAENAFDTVQCLPLAVVGDNPALRVICDNESYVYARFFDSSRTIITDAVVSENFYEYTSLNYEATSNENIRGNTTRVTKGILTIPENVAYIELYLNRAHQNIQLFTNSLSLDSQATRYFQPWEDIATNVARINA